MMDRAFNSFIHPDDIYYGTDFLMLNGALDDEELVRQLRDMRSRGVRSFVARTYVGLKSDYPGPDFMSKMHICVNTARELGMKLYLQAGYMPDAVVGISECDKLKLLKIEKEADFTENDRKRVLSRKCGYVIYESGDCDFLDMFSRDAVKTYIKTCCEDFWQEFRDEFGKTVMSIWIDEPSYPMGHLPMPSGLEERFLARFGYPLTDNLIALYLDTGSYMTVRYHYWLLLSEMLEESFFSQISEWCRENGLLMSGHLLFEETLESQISRACALMPYYKYLDIPGIDILSTQQNWRHRELLPVTGREYRYREVMMNTPLQCASAARQAGKEHILCEMYGVTSEDLGFREQKHLFDYTAAYGINHRSIHGIFYSLKGRAKRLYPPHINYYQPYWNDISIMNNYVASVSSFVSMGSPVINNLVIHPLESAYCEYTCLADAKAVTGVMESRDRLRRRDYEFINFTSSVLTSGGCFDFADEGTVASSAVAQDGLFTVGRMSYSTVILPSLSTIRATTLEKIKSFAASGGRVIVMGDFPTMLDGIETRRNLLADIPGVIYTQSISETVSLMDDNGYTVSTSDGGAGILARRCDDGDCSYYFLFNTDCQESKHITLTVDSTVLAEEWDALKYQTRPLECNYSSEATVISVTVPEGGSVLIRTVKTQNAENAKNKNDKAEYTLSLSPEWKIKREDPNVLLFDFFSYKKEGGEWSDEYPILAIKHILTDDGYRGKVALKCKFRSENSIAGARLSLEDADEYSIYLNGIKVENKKDGFFVSRDFETVSLPEINEGENELILVRDFAPFDQAYLGGCSLFAEREGTELEPMYLVGDFAVKMQSEPTRCGMLRYSRCGVSLAKESSNVRGELTGRGYPYFAGTVSLESTFDWSFDTDGAVLSLEELDGCLVRVIVNGKDVGAICSMPYSLDISSALQSGENTLTLRLTNTLRNLIGPHHRPDGERGIVRGTYDDSDLGWMGARDNSDKEWYLDRAVDTPYWTDSYMLSRFGISGVKISAPVKK